MSLLSTLDSKPVVNCACQFSFATTKFAAEDKRISSHWVGNCVLIFVCCRFCCC